MTGKGIVLRTDGERATVRVVRSSACGHDCGECRICQNSNIETQILNPIGAKVGDMVLIGTDTTKVLQDTFMLYLLPVLGAMIFYALGRYFRLFVGIEFVLVGLFVLLWYIYMRHYSKNKVSLSTALEVLYEED